MGLYGSSREIESLDSPHYEKASSERFRSTVELVIDVVTFVWCSKAPFASSFVAAQLVAAADAHRKLIL